MTGIAAVCPQCGDTIQLGDIVNSTNTADMVHRDCHPNHDIADTCPDCNLALEWSKFGYWIHHDTGVVTCPGETPEPKRHLHLVRSQQPMTQPTHCGCGNPTDGTSTCRDCVKGYE